MYLIRFITKMTTPIKRLNTQHQTQLIDQLFCLLAVITLDVTVSPRGMKQDRMMVL